MEAAMKHPYIIASCLILGMAAFVGVVYDKVAAVLVALVGFAVIAVMKS